METEMGRIWFIFYSEINLLCSSIIWLSVFCIILSEAGASDYSKKAADHLGQLLIEKKNLGNF
jgi:hypothetical protein